MSEIKVGDYIRTRTKGIKRIDKIDDNKTVNKYLSLISSVGGEYEYEIIKTTDVVKHSLNIIDLIEYGDYVNGDRVEYECCQSPHNDNVLDINFGHSIYKNEIRSIVTHEQFNSMKYIVKE